MCSRLHLRIGSSHSYFTKITKLLAFICWQKQDVKLIWLLHLTKFVINSLLRTILRLKYLDEVSFASNVSQTSPRARVIKATRASHLGSPGCPFWKLLLQNSTFTKDLLLAVPFSSFLTTVNYCSPTFSSFFSTVEYCLLRCNGKTSQKDATPLYRFASKLLSFYLDLDTPSNHIAHWHLVTKNITVAKCQLVFSNIIFTSS